MYMFSFLTGSLVSVKRVDKGNIAMTEEVLQQLNQVFTDSVCPRQFQHRVIHVFSFQHNATLTIHNGSVYVFVFMKI
jgi:hypothetical protein